MCTRHVVSGNLNHAITERMSVRLSVLSQSILLSCALSSSCAARCPSIETAMRGDSIRDFDVVCSSCLFLPFSLFVNLGIVGSRPVRGHSVVFLLPKS
jgi:hypothetical protein